MSLLQWFVVITIAVPIGLTIVNRLRVDIAALMIAVILSIGQFAGLGVLGPAHTPQNAEKVLAGLGRPEIAVLLGLFVIMRGVERTGIALLLARRLTKLSGSSERRLIALFSSAAALLSLFMNNVAVGSLLLPPAMEAARRTEIKPSKLLMPIAFATALGGAATYFTTANIVISGLLPLADPPQAPLGILAFTPVGGLIALAGLVYLVLFSSRLLPNRIAINQTLIPRYTSSQLEKLYQLEDRLWEARVLPGSSLSGKTLAQTAIGERFGLTVVAIWRDHHAILVPPPYHLLRPGDMLVIVGREDRINQLRQEGLKVGRSTENGHIRGHDAALIEVVLAPHSPLEGRTFKELEFRKKYGFTVVAVWREGSSYRTDVADFKLKLGDSYLMVGPRNGLRALQVSPDFIVLETDDSDAVSLPKALTSVGIVLVAVAASVLGFPIYLAMLLGAVLTIVARLLPPDEAYRSVPWSVMVLIAGMYTASIAFVETGLAEHIGRQMIDIAGPLGPLGLAGGVFLLTALLTQVMGSQVTALVTGPIAITAAITFHTDPQAIAVAAAMGCSASFLTPLAHPINTLMIGPANYKFTDFFRLGAGLTIIMFAALLVGLELFWAL